MNYGEDIDFNPVPIFEKLNIPVLSLLGELDVETPVRETVATLERIKKERSKDFTVIVFSGPDRTLYMQWHRGDVPELYRAFAARTQRYKLVQPVGSGEGLRPERPVFKLYDMANDPLEIRDIAHEHPEIVERMRKDYETWFKDVTSRRDYVHPSRIFIGALQENSVRLTRQDWRGPQAGWTPTSLGH